MLKLAVDQNKFLAIGKLYPVKDTKNYKILYYSNNGFILCVHYVTTNHDKAAFSMNCTLT